jgi:hypothetical protein
LLPVLARTAAAQQAGVINDHHAAVISNTITTLPTPIRAEHADAVEATLLELATTLHPGELTRAATRILAHLHPDGPEPVAPAEQHHDQQRHLHPRINRDRSGQLTAHLNPETTAQLQAVLGTLSKPHPEPTGSITGNPQATDADATDADAPAGEHDPATGRDLRTPGQRQHDALAEVLARVLRSDTLPDTGGPPATVAITIPLDVLEHRVKQHRVNHHGDVGYATSRGHDLTVEEMLRVASEARLIPIVIDKVGIPLALGYSTRYATPAQRHVLAARDRGCTFPGSTIPPEWCQTHHIRPWIPINSDQDAGPTNPDNLTLLCPYHHHAFETWNWQVTMQDGRPWWTPPKTHDPEQKPIQNTAHHHPITFDQSDIDDGRSHDDPGDGVASLP